MSKDWVSPLVKAISQDVLAMSDEEILAETPRSEIEAARRAGLKALRDAPEQKCKIDDTDERALSKATRPEGSQGHE